MAQLSENTFVHLNLIELIWMKSVIKSLYDHDDNIKMWHKVVPECDRVWVTLNKVTLMALIYTDSLW